MPRCSSSGQAPGPHTKKVHIHEYFKSNIRRLILKTEKISVLKSTEKINDSFQILKIQRNFNLPPATANITSLVPLPHTVYRGTKIIECQGPMIYRGPKTNECLKHYTSLY